jgi:hypothetical protein
VNAPQNWPQQPNQPQGYGMPPQQPPQQQPPQQQPYQQPYYQQQQPPKKKRTGLLVGIAVVAVLLVVGGVLGSMYLDYNEDVGGGPGDKPVAQCEISGELQRQARVSSFRIAGPPAERGYKQSNCFWEQTKGKDGKNPRTLNIMVYDSSEASNNDSRNLDQAKSNYASQTTQPAQGDQAKPTDGLGDEATFVIPGARTDLTEVDLVVRKGAVVYLIKYFGRDKGFFSDTEFPAAEAEAVVRKAAEELTR